MESLIATIVILLLSALANWAQKRAESQDSSPPIPPPKPRQPRAAPHPSRPQPQPQPPSPKARPSLPQFDLEEKLRRLLQGEPEMPPSEPPPIIRTERPASAPRPIVVSKPLPAPRTEPARPAPVSGRPFVEEPEGGALQTEVTEAAAAYQRAQHLHEATAQRLKEVTERGKQHRAGAGAERLLNTEIADAVALLRSRQGIRKAMIASIVLGSPLALQKPTPL